MSRDETFLTLLERWDDLRQQGQDVSPDQLCPGRPDLASQLRIEIEKLKEMDWLDQSPNQSSETSGLQSQRSTDELKIGRARIPSVLNDRYQMESLVAEGGFGQVWRATDRTLQRAVAIKVTTIDCHSEARRVAQLKHQGIVTVHDVGNAGGLCYIVFDMVEGTTLAEKIARQRPSPQKSARMIAQVAEIVQFAHNKGFIHRDLKPANILIDESGMPVLADFGIAVTECELRHEAATSIGTLAYMAPEQLRPGGMIDVRTDVYGLGVVFYELLTGALPFSGETLGQLRGQILRGNPLSPRSFNSEIPDVYAQICLKCLSLDANRRYSSAQQLADVVRQGMTTG